MTHERLRLGAGGEQLAASWYEARGYEIVARNWTCRSGELDLVVRKGRLFVFCEVKTRTTDAFGVPAESVTREKQARVRQLAARWLADSPIHAVEIRFDVAAILAGELEMIEGAF